MQYACIMKVYAWDEFAERQLQRLNKAVHDGAVFVSGDETNGALSVPRNVRYAPTSCKAMIESGFSERVEQGSLFWWNADYPHYDFFKKHPDFDYYVFVEYDACVLGDLDAVIAQIRREKIDFAALPIEQDMDKWHWSQIQKDIYPKKDMRASLACISIFSHHALQLLMERRLQMAKTYRGRRWPMAELFLGSEIRKLGLKQTSLQKFGNVEKLSWFPPTLEDDLPDVENGTTFIHPVLDIERYIRSKLQHNKRLISFISPKSHLRKDLDRVGPITYFRLLQAFTKRAKVNLSEQWACMRSRVGHY
ncbi:hypothetical protein [Kozakia baliensis]|nr:hypothetical protein [Kozakia baliensis]GEL64075.1 hypothetical protein KBA01_13610 [Kozakia baliensis]